MALSPLVGLRVLRDPVSGSDPQQLILATAGGDRQAFKALYDTTSRRLFGIILRIVRRVDWAEDVLQEVYVRIWRHAERYRPEKGEPMAWLATVARNGAIDWRRRNADAPWVQEYDDQDGQEDDQPTVLDWTAAAEDARALKHCLDELEGEHRNCIVLAYTEGYTHDELARRLSRPVGTVKSWIRRGLLRLRDCLEG